MGDSVGNGKAAFFVELWGAPGLALVCLHSGDQNHMCSGGLTLGRQLSLTMRGYWDFKKNNNTNPIMIKDY